MLTSTIFHDQKGYISNFWFFFGALALSFSWLLPNHYMPWTGFHADAWAATVLSLTSVVVIFRSSSYVEWDSISTLTAVLIFLVFFQYISGLIPFAGQAWISAAYLIGFLLAILVGTHWEKIYKDQLPNGLFISIGIASIVSVILQLCQWFGLYPLDLMMVKMTGNRPYANLGQPNQLATLLLWGILACAWGVTSEKISSTIFLLFISILIFGIALTQSRTAWIGLFIILFSAWWWRKFWSAKKIYILLLFTSCYFLFCVLLVYWLDANFEINKLPPVAERFSSEIRPIAWWLFLDAIWQKPWLGYGFTEVAQAQLDLSLYYPSLGGAFGQAHNIFLDLLLWFGAPIGILVCMLIIYWLVKCISLIKNGKDSILITALLVIGNHALLELPLHYAYFLLPTGLLIGIVNFRLKNLILFRTSKWVLYCLWALGVTCLSLIIYDYFRIESNFNSWLYERANIGTQKINVVPDVFVLTQLHEKMRFARIEIKEGLKDEELEWMRKVVRWSPSAFELHKISTAMAVSGRTAEAGMWLKKLCKVNSYQQCELVGRVWNEQATKNEKIAKIKWLNGDFIIDNKKLGSDSN